MKIWRRCGSGFLTGLVFFTAMLTANAEVVPVSFDGLSVYLTGENAQTQKNADGTDGYYNRNASGVIGEGGRFVTDGVSFSNSLHYDAGYDYYYWGGFAVSNVKNTTTPGMDGWNLVNEYGAYTDDRSNGENYLVGYWNSVLEAPTITLSPGLSFETILISNTTYAALVVGNGNSFAYPFSEEGDLFQLVVHGYDATGVDLEYEVELAAYTNGQLSILDEWTEINLRELGFAGDTIWFTMTTTDEDPDYGPNTPLYFAVGGMTVAMAVPEPSSVMILAGAGLVGVVMYRRRGMGSRK
ncbi:MAG: DUF4465 domain-containing protein [Planctomycetia bacterium]|nr:DUF4465 domain-containing protein [Planctomycetia bacterium]